MSECSEPTSCGTLCLFFTVKKIFLVGPFFTFQLECFWNGGVYNKLCQNLSRENWAQPKAKNTRKWNTISTLRQGLMATAKGSKETSLFIEPYCTSKTRELRQLYFYIYHTNTTAVRPVLWVSLVYNSGVRLGVFQLRNTFSSPDSNKTWLTRILANFNPLSRAVSCGPSIFFVFASGCRAVQN